MDLSDAITKKQEVIDDYNNKLTKSKEENGELNEILTKLKDEKENIKNAYKLITKEISDSIDGNWFGATKNHFTDYLVYNYIENKYNVDIEALSELITMVKRKISSNNLIIFGLEQEIKIESNLLERMKK